MAGADAMLGMVSGAVIDLGMGWAGAAATRSAPEKVPRSAKIIAQQRNLSNNSQF
jgi:hypothetical protein